ncbi:MAG: diguanylate cyclase [Pseudomonadota bacterium]
MFVESLHLAIERARRSGAPMALAYLDIDHTKRIKDSHGHAPGDELLQECARPDGQRARDRHRGAPVGRRVRGHLRRPQQRAGSDGGGGEDRRRCGCRSSWRACGWRSPPASASTAGSCAC